MPYPPRNAAYMSYPHKDEVARPLATAFREAGLKVWFAEDVLEIGDSIRRSIEAGLAQSTWGVVVLSPAFFERKWPQSELDGLFSLEVAGAQLILPVWHNVSEEDVRRHSPATGHPRGLDITSLLGLARETRSECPIPSSPAPLSAPVLLRCMRSSASPASFHPTVPLFGTPFPPPGPLERVPRLHEHYEVLRFPDPPPAARRVAGLYALPAIAIGFMGNMIGF